MQAPAADHALSILGYLARQARPVPATTLALGVGLPRSTTYHLLTVLTRHGFVVHYPEEHVYGLGIAAYELGSGYTRQAPLQRLARKPVADLADLCRNSVHLAVLRGSDVIYVIEERAANRPRLITDVGVRLPAHRTASGRALLAALPQPQLSALYPNAAALGDHTGAAPRTVSGLRRMLVDVRNRGYATEVGEVTAGLASVAMAISDAHGYPIAAVTVTYPESTAGGDVPPTTLGHLAGTVRTLQYRLRATA